MIATVGRPQFIEELSQAHYARLCRCVILTGNIHDLFPIPTDGEAQFVSLDRALHATLAQARYPKSGGSERFIVLALESEGLVVRSPDDRAELAASASALSNAVGDPELAGLAAKLDGVLARIHEESLPALEGLRAVGDLLRTVARARNLGIPVRPIAVVVDHAEMLFPHRETASLGGEDREALKYIYDLLQDEEIWADAETAELRPDLLILLSPTITELNRRILALAKTIQIDIPLPDEGIRSLFVQRRAAAAPLALDYPSSASPMDDLVKDTRGLRLRTLDDLLTRSQRVGPALGRREVVEEVNRELRAKLGDVIKIIYPDHNMGDIVGCRKLKLRLEHLRRRIDNPERAPAGMTVVGPNGSGKTFVCEAFAAASGRVVVTMSQVRSQWFGQTDVLAEMFESALSVFGRILVLVDEAHVAFGSIHDPHTHETEARLARHIIQMMDNASNRGSIFWSLMTTRPDLLDPDIVRRGRCSLFVPVFDPEGEDAEEFLNWMLRDFSKGGVALAPDDIELLRKQSAGFSAGDYREFISDFLEEKQFTPQLSLTDFLDSWTPSAVSLADEREVQILLAALRCDWRELLPTTLRDSPHELMRERLERLKGGL